MNRTDEHSQIKASTPDHPPLHSTVPPSNVERRTDELTNTLRTTCTQFLKSTSGATGELFSSLFGRAESSLRQLVQESGLLEASTKASEIDAYTAWSRLRAFRQGLQTTVVTPTRSTLGQAALFSKTNDQFEQLLQTVGKAHEVLPESIERPEPGGVFDASPSDSTLLKAQKFLIRTQRRLGRIGKSEPRQQRVFLRAIAHAYSRNILPGVMAQQMRLGLSEAGVALAHIERDLTRLMHELLIAEVKLDKAEYHIAASEDLPEIPPPDSESASAQQRGPGDEKSEDSSSIHGALLDHIRTYNARLMRSLAAAKAVDLGGWQNTTAVRIDDVLDALQTDIERSDSFLSKRVVAQGSVQSNHAGSPAARLFPRWNDWYKQVLSRLDFCLALGELRDELGRLQFEAIDGALTTGIIPAARAHVRTAAELEHLHAQADEFLRGAQNRYGRDVIVGQLQKLLKRSSEIIQQDLIGAIRDQTVSNEFADAGARVQNRLNEAATRFSDGYQLHALIDEDDTRIDLNDDVRTVDLSSIVLEALTESFAIAFTDVSSVLSNLVETLTKQDREILAVIEFNIGAAIDELEDARSKYLNAEALGLAVSASGELTLNGLARSEEALLEERSNLAPIALQVARRLFMAHREVWTYIHEHARPENQVQQALVSVRAQAAIQGRLFLSKAGKQLLALRGNIRKITWIGKRRAQQLVKLGQEAVGAQVQQAEAFEETMVSLSATNDVIAAAPLVYRRLFTFRALTDPELLEGRTDDKRKVVKHVQTWKRGLPQALLLTGVPSSGITSFLNLLSETVFSEITVSTLQFTERIRDEKTLTRLIFDALQLTPSEVPVRPRTLAELSKAILSLPEKEPAPVCFIEHLELLFLRKIDGTRLISEFLTMISRTDSRIIWILTIADFGWQLIEKSEPRAARLISRHALSEIDRATLEKLVLKRHSRSGLNLEFHEPEDPGPLLARRLRRAKSKEDAQALLQETFFDRLHTHCGQNIMLALFYWMSSISSNDEESAVTVKLFNPLRFGFLAGHTLEQSLALKALLEHDTLTVEEHAEINSETQENSMEIFESLGNALLIEPVNNSTDVDQFELMVVEPNTPYRIRPLIVHPIIQYLRSKNIVH